MALSSVSVDQRSADTLLPPLALYLHIPFCATRCTYCAFNTYTSLHHQIAAYMQALSIELRWLGSDQKRAADTLYFGGGTPSLVSPTDLAIVLDQVRASFSLPSNTEITLEANPGDCDGEYFRQVLAQGVNRLSIGMQSAHASELRLFARRHTADDVDVAVRTARRAGFANISLDLIYGIPDQTLPMWQHSLRTALAMQPDHVSLYSLGIEDSTPMHRWVTRGQIVPPDPDQAADMYEWASDYLAQEGLIQYEISNWSRPGFACRHNLHYWRNEAYLGCGAGAHGFAAHTRYVNVMRPETYVRRLIAQQTPRAFPLSDAAEEVVSSSETQAISDTLIMGLRLVEEGVQFAEFCRRHKMELRQAFSPTIDRLSTYGLLEVLSDRIRLTSRARLLGNRVFAEFLLEE